ncbi:MAG: DUF58 domain-containing protein [Planctomycetaceae bacterium]
MKKRRRDRWRMGSALWRSWRYEITPAGKTVVFAGLVGSVGMISVRIPMYMVGVGLGALFVVAMFTAFVFWPRVSVRGRFPEKTLAGEPVTAQFVVTPTSRWPVFDLGLGFFGLPAGLHEIESDVTVRHLPRGETALMPVTLRADHRGMYELPPLRAFTTFPFNLFRVGLNRSELERLLVLPAFEPLGRIDLQVRARYQPGGIVLTSNVGEAPEYIGNREYVPGEPARRLDFRSWARLGRPVVREYQEEYYCRIALILDTWTGDANPAARESGSRTSKSASSPSSPAANRRRSSWLNAIRKGPRKRAAREASERLEGAVSLAASVADALCNGEYIIDLFAAGPELYVFRSGRHTAHFENVLEILAGVGHCPEDPFAAVTPAVADELGSISAAVCIFLDWDTARAHLVRTILEAGCSLLVVIVRDGPTTEPCAPIDGVTIQRFTPAEVAAGGLDLIGE